MHERDSLIALYTKRNGLTLLINNRFINALTCQKIILYTIYIACTIIFVQSVVCCKLTFKGS